MQTDKAVRNIVVLVVLSFVCLFVFLKLFGPLPFFVQSVNTAKQTLFTVNGTGEVTIVPDTVLLSIGVTKSASTVEIAKSQVNAVANKISQDLKGLGIDIKDIQTTNFSVNPQYDYSRGDQKITGYTVDTSMNVKLQPIDKANSAVDIVTKDGANQVGGVQFTVDDAKQKSLEDEARKKAIEDAKQKAQSLANAAGIHLGRIVDIQESGGNNPRPYTPMLMDAAAKSVSDSTQLNPGENKITSMITLSYETY